MPTEMVFTEEKHIPVCKIFTLDDNQERMVEFKNPRTKKRECMSLEKFIQMLRSKGI